MRIVAISFVLEASLLTGLRLLGVMGMVASEKIPEALVPAVRAVLAGQTYYSRAVLATMDGSAPAS